MASEVRYCFWVSVVLGIMDMVTYESVGLNMILVGLEQRAEKAELL